MSFDNPLVVQSISAVPSSPLHGELVVIKIRVATLGYLPFTFPCWLEIDGAATPVEQHTSRPVSNTDEIHMAWIAVAGSHRIAGCAGPQGSDRRLLDNRAELQLEVALPQGGRWLEEWKEAARRGVKSWLAGSRVHGGTVNALDDRITPGSLTSDRSLYEAMLARLLDQGEPAAVAAAVSNAVDKAWRNWFDGYSVSLVYDPGFAGWPGSFHPPSPNLPTPLSTGASSHAGDLLPDGLGGRLRDELRSLAPALSGIIDTFAAWFAGRFAVWQTTTLLVNVMASGPVPTYAPPYVPIGPVMGGSLDAGPGFLSDHGAFDGG